MSFDIPTGTRGGWQPRTGGRIGRWLNDRMIGRIRRTGKAPGLHFDALVLATVGARTGLPRSTPVGWFPGDDGTWLIVAAAAGGQRNPAWYHNLAAHPDQVRIEMAGTTVDVVADQLGGVERDRAWQRITTAVPRFTSYQAKTDRRLPIIRLTPRDPAQRRR